MNPTEQPQNSTTASEPLYVAETLAWCNSKRVEQNLEPLTQLPLGKRSDGNSCPCGKASGWHVLTGWARRSEHDEWQMLPAGVKLFIKAFDDGELPQYEEAT